MFCTERGAQSPEWETLVDAQAAAYAADGHARCTGEPAAVVAADADESCKLAAALLTAWGDRQAVVAVTPRDGSPSAAFGAVTRRRVDLDADIPPPQALDAAATPAHVSVTPGFDLTGWLDRVQVIEPRGEEPADHAVDSTVRLLARSRNPLIVLGAAGVRTCDPAEVAAAATRFDCPVLLTAAATTMPPARLSTYRAAFGYGSPLVPSGTGPWTRALAGADTVLALGTALSEVDWFGLRDARLVRAHVVRVGVEAHADDPATEFHAADAGCFTHAIAAATEPVATPTRSRRWIRACERWNERVSAQARAHAGRDHVEPCLAAYEIARRAPEGMIFTAEGGSSGMWLWANLWLRPLLFPVQNGTLGVSIPYAIAAKSAHPDRPVWTVVGDGAFFYHAGELPRLVRRRIPLVILVFDDSSWSAIRLGETFFYNGRSERTDLVPADHAALARDLGCEAVTVRKPSDLTQALEQARRHTQGPPLVIDIALPRDHVPYHGANFVSAELDGAFRHLALRSVRSTVAALGSGRVSPRTIRSLIRVST